jgi:hypothetical protein
MFGRLRNWLVTPQKRDLIVQSGVIERSGGSIDRAEWEKLIESHPSLKPLPGQYGTSPFTGEKVLFPRKGVAGCIVDGMERGSLFRELIERAARTCMSDQMFSDDNDFPPKLEPTQSRGSLLLGFTIGCVVFLIATVLLVAVLTQLAVTRHPEKMELKDLFLLAIAGITVILIGTVATVRTIVAAGEKSKGRFSVLSLLVAVTIVSVAIGLITYVVRR